MQNDLFSVKFNANGTIKSIINPLDSFKMNWVDDSFEWGSIRYRDYIQREDSKGNWSINDYTYLPKTDGKQDNEQVFCSYKNNDISVNVERFFNADGSLTEKYTLKNLRKYDLFLEQGDVSIALPFNDVYTYADECMTNRCNTHIWCGGNTTYVKALKMGESDINLGLILIIFCRNI